jgi:hypothetical protein
VRTVRVFAGYESPEGVPDPVHARGFWFDETGRLLKSFSSGLETQRSEFQDFNGIQIAHQVSVLENNAIAMMIEVSQVLPGLAGNSESFDLRGHKHTRALTDEVR